MDETRIAGLLAEIENNYPNLHFEIHEKRAVLRGTFPVEFDAALIDRFAIEISIPEDFPETVPIVREMGGRIPWGLDHHNVGGIACLFVPDERWRVWPRGCNLLDFLNGPVRNYFMGQSLVMRGEDWPFGERGHGMIGIIDFYEDLFKTRDPERILSYLACMVTKDIEMRRKMSCGRSKKVVECYLRQIDRLCDEIPQKAAEEMLRIRGMDLLREARRRWYREVLAL